jgi:hypothetical protein
MIRPRSATAALALGLAAALLAVVDAKRDDNPYCDIDPKTIDPAEDL